MDLNMMVLAGRNSANTVGKTAQTFREHTEK
jgi:hypothetical protein